ncbi:sulfotransferase domain-containing protein [Phytoactinopolyspora alkaliphila]|uniref:Sulfotransferase domain-containing protein n=1 Tax=Phytoactinopolyspora alkaliphila TaxID=1783498 RepID=A0A6N9YPX3_9ACTN|nr:sulfotransferase [Phytoactinopolyspora alkaliphila]NED97014.1 sulfotransferase domain-containing protein [Phytoactinopolyspora alkaliphila]
MTRTLPNLVIIGAMKCATTALHHYLDQHPDIGMSNPKELNFFWGPASVNGDSPASTWHRGVEWYARQFQPTPIRGESSPGYTSPDHPEAAARMAAVIPDTAVVYLVRDPVERAVSQYWHHRADGDETRPMHAAILDPDSQYISRGRYFERLMPYLEHFDPARIAVVSQEQLFSDHENVLRSLFRFLGVDPGRWTATASQEWNTSLRRTDALTDSIRAELGERFRDDTEKLRAFTGQVFPEWSV